MTMINPKPFNGYNHKKEKVDLLHIRPLLLMRPTEVHLKEDGSVKDEPSLTIVMKRRDQSVAGEISLEMLNDGLADIGYTITKLP